MERQANSVIFNTVYRTNDYDMFLRLEGNRDVLSGRVNKIIRSIRKNGYIINPIIVNEKYEIIDGQGRLEALHEMRLPVDYIVCPGFGRKECIALNAYSTIWSMADYISSYCEEGNENYIRLRDVMKSFPDMEAPIKIIIATGMSAVQSTIIKEGRLTVTEEMAETAKEDLRFAQRFSEALKRVKGTRKFYVYGLVFAKKCGARPSRLLEVMERNELPPAPNLRIALDIISDFYNKNLRTKEKRIYLYKEYEETMTQKYGWYGAKWGGKD